MDRSLNWRTFRRSSLSWLIACVLGSIAFGGCASPADSGLHPEVEEIHTTSSPIRVVSNAELDAMKSYVAERSDPRIVVKSIVLNDREQVDCVDMRLQHGFSKRILTIAAPPEEAPSVAKSASSPADSEAIQEYGAHSETCPVGSIPRLRLRIEELQRFRTLRDYMKKVPSHLSNRAGDSAMSLATGPTDLHQHAVARQHVSNIGAEGVLNLWSPYTGLASEFSLSQLWVMGGDGDDAETVEAGWQVFKDMYGDSRARLFIYFTPDNYGSGGCYNLTCNGFVQVDNSVAIGTAWSAYSSRGGAQYTISLRLQRSAEGHWWLRYGTKWLGYWPNSKFDAKGIATQADTIQFGGEILDRRGSGLHTSTDMGSGLFPAMGFGQTAYQRNLAYYYGAASSPFINDANPWIWVTGWLCYDATTAFDGSSWRRYVYFGGPGLSAECF